jgi:hypothetical protein
MALATFTVDTSLYANTVYGANRIVFGKLTCNGTSNSFVVAGLKHICFVGLTPKSATSSYNTVTWSTATTAGLVNVVSATTGDDYGVFAIGR